MSINDTNNITATSGLHDPSSPYYDPTLNVEWAEGATVRSYTGIGSSDLDRRADETVNEASDTIAQFTAGYDAAQVIVTAEEIGKVLYQMDLADGIDPDADYGRSGEGWLRTAALRPSNQQMRKKANDPEFEILNIGLDAIPVQTWRDAPAGANALADGLGGYDFCPMIGWSEANGPDSVVGKALMGRGKIDEAATLIAFAQVWLPQSARVKPARRWNGRIIDPTVEGSLFAVAPLRTSQPWLPAASMRGIVKIYDNDSDLERDIANVRAELQRLRAAERATAYIDDIVAEPEEPRRFRK